MDRPALIEEKLTHRLSKVLSFLDLAFYELCGDPDPKIGEELQYTDKIDELVCILENTKNEIKSFHDNLTETTDLICRQQRDPDVVRRRGIQLVKKDDLNK